MPPARDGSRPDRRVPHLSRHRSRFGLRATVIAHDPGLPSSRGTLDFGPKAGADVADDARGGCAVAFTGGLN
jgi:hypothetical protein